jgi:hypothetical protein
VIYDSIPKVVIAECYHGENYDIFATTANYSTTITIDVNNGGHSILPYTTHDGEVSVNQHVLHDCTDPYCSRLIHTPASILNYSIYRNTCSCVSRVCMHIPYEHVYLV